MAQARIIDQETDLQLESGDYILVDSLDEGTRKFDLGGHIESTGEAISELSNKIGDSTMGTTATTITGAIAEHEGDISSLSGLIARAGSSIAQQQALTTTAALVRCTSLSYNVGNLFTLVSDGGFRCSKTGRVRVTGFMHVSGVTSGDEIGLGVGTYSGGWAYESYSMRSKTVTVAIDIFISVSANQIIYIRANNNSGARGNIDSAQIAVEWLSE